MAENPGARKVITSFSLSPELTGKLRMAAAYEGLSTSAFVEQVLIDAIRKVEDEAGFPMQPRRTEPSQSE